MSKQNRHQLILDLVQTKGNVQVSELAARIGVSEMTIRRDLEALEQVGALTRVHGGAAAPPSRSYEPAYHARRLQRVDDKERIGRAAAELIHDGETVIIDAGTTTLEVAKALRGRRNLRVLALSLRIADLLADEPGLTVMIPGGITRPGERSIIGAMTQRAFADLYFDTLVLSAGGVDPEAGVTEYIPEDAAVKQAATASARRKIVVTDSTKIGTIAFARVCGVEQLDTVVTDKNVDPALAHAIAERGPEVVTV
ncbi:DeoR/GlpR family transcriptional regulator of sugar metabolism [Kibdelosporangium banguiense]|uniref:Lactose phosphotransferase system repressor n=1 Tax=Kibdelosporangium banguiense TaxID=1365924 RepID=A0ABS4TGL1_9PSEU|nr:DeoR/GlpR family DNA-binding transcription regulator [Kibdelosporangium banguiense]MBP2323466.1 DeoR/GlpR family transcriptional regulator of sugar metabolism [Kibdelosporangium banguiense]